MISLRHLVPEGEKARLIRILTRILGERFCLLSEDGTVFIGTQFDGELYPVQLEQKNVAWVGAPGSTNEQRNLAAEICELLFEACSWGSRQEHALRQKYQAEKLAAVGRLAAGIAHEINNPAGYIHSNLQMASRYLQQLGELAPAVLHRKWAELQAIWGRHHLDQVLADFPELLTESQQGIERIGHIVRDLRLFSCVDRNNEDVVNLNELLESVAQIVRKQLYPGQILNMDLHPLPLFPCLPGYLNQAFLEIMTNARLALNGSPEGRITVFSESNNDEMHIRIVDNGVGMSQDTLAHVFEPFYTTRAPNEGSGLGLTVARDIILAHDGWIDIDSIPGCGTTVMLRLPGA